MTALEIKSLRTEVKQLIEEADVDALKAIYSMFKISKGDDWWDTISAGERDAIEIGLAQLENGEGIPHSEVKKLYPQWFAK